MRKLMFFGVAVWFVFHHSTTPAYTFMKGIGYVLKNGATACYRLSDHELYYSIPWDDKLARSKLESENRCVHLEAGTTVYVVETIGKQAQVRRHGELQTLWLNANALVTSIEYEEAERTRKVAKEREKAAESFRDYKVKLISEKKICHGMSEDEVLQAWGAPLRVIPVRSNLGNFTRWEYQYATVHYNNGQVSEIVTAKSSQNR